MIQSRMETGKLQPLHMNQRTTKHAQGQIFYPELKPSL
jgi:hypothetical protein